LAKNHRPNGAVVISGTSSGIGHATALLLDQSGYRVFAGVRREDDAQRLQAKASERLRTLILDITCQDQIDGAVVAVKEALGPEEGLAGLVNNAGICEPGPIELIGMDRFRRQIEVNLIGHVAMIQAMLPLVRQGRGRIINVSSATGRFALPILGAYVASKWALEGMSDALRRELRWLGIPVSIIEPGTVEAPLWDKTPDSIDMFPDEQIAGKNELYDELAAAVRDLMQRGRSVATEPEVLARVIKKAIEARRPKARYCCGPGARMAVLGSRLPEFLTDWVTEKILRKKLPPKLMGW